MDCALLVVPGGDSSPISHLLWALHEERLSVRWLHVVTYIDSRRWFDLEFMGGANPEQQLRSAGLDFETVPHEARRSDGTLIQSDESDEDAKAFIESIWKVAQDLVSKPEPVIFGLTGGSRRTLNVNLSTVFQLLARHKDKMYDTRVSDKSLLKPEVGFYFPKQTSLVNLKNNGKNINPSEIKIQTIEVVVPRLSTWMNRSNVKYLQSFQNALKLAQSLSENLEIKILQHNFEEKTISIEYNSKEIKCPLSQSQKIFYAAIAYKTYLGDKYKPFNNNNNKDKCYEIYNILFEFIKYSNVKQKGKMAKFYEDVIFSDIKMDELSNFEFEKGSKKRKSNFYKQSRKSLTEFISKLKTTLSGCILPVISDKYSLNISPSNIHFDPKP